MSSEIGCQSTSCAVEFKSIVHQCADSLECHIVRSDLLECLRELEVVERRLLDDELSDSISQEVLLLLTIKEKQNILRKLIEYRERFAPPQPLPKRPRKS